MPFMRYLALSSVHKIGSSIVPSSSGINTNPANLSFVKNLIVQLTDELYALARKKIGGTVIIYHLCEDTADWQATKETFISPPIPFNQLYKPGAFEKIFTSKGREHDGAVIFYLRNGLIDSVSAKLFMVKHDCENKCASRGTRHSSACSFSNFTPVPLTVISEEKGQVSLFSNGRAQIDIGMEDLKKELLKAYVTQEKSCMAYITFDDKKFAKYFNLNPLITDDTWYRNSYWLNQMDLHKGISFTLNEKFLPDREDRIITSKYREHDALVTKCIEYNYGDDISAYHNKEEQCLILSHGNKRLGGFFYKIVDKTIVFGNFFLLRQLLHNDFAARFLKEVFWKKMHYHCNSMEFLVPDHLEKSFANLIEALNDKEESSLRVKCRLLYGTADSPMNEVFTPDDYYDD